MKTESYTQHGYKLRFYMDRHRKTGCQPVLERGGNRLTACFTVFSRIAKSVNYARWQYKREN